ncbi:merozoite-associated tryptophan-rich antigen, putative [Plasmodium sp. gorilla clade G2]|uniref:merozoite-associated tryptophan-rich antigen, putative n=1 Tax=Plasmodium sp. gorilla clade G2 TaxID=880535 RepID=UPI000D210533|nr:merozoite-associated tryptophan-rich antigen, putative [Plasmodium sp. gorilla clade G2]XP_028541288.1 merozoite-associated tryptophan-rich antigen, putative [Plasmodium sp. gorilla clade G2]SOV10183.1 merozoite-associated tryptophan-rich antigen, putative [Plasmodium sp. gorilla clade G2]SOV20219.1 merozoite-associated tryptophan-rich antigen, putative [Plasmodium sp. gorilla clade G2]
MIFHKCFKVCSLSCAILWGIVTSSIIQPDKQQEKDQLSNHFISTEQLLDISEKWKALEWNNWFSRMENEWENLNLVLQNDKRNILQDRHSNWKEWIQHLENKWENINENINPEYKTNLLHISLTWNEEQWGNWAYNTLKCFLENDWNILIKEITEQINTHIDQRWIKWLHEQNSIWLSNDWIIDENAFWENMIKLDSSKYAWTQEVKQYFIKWNERTNHQNFMWNNWIHNKNKIINHIKKDNLDDWTKDKYDSFNKWREIFLQDWITSQKWKKLAK